MNADIEPDRPFMWYGAPAPFSHPVPPANRIMTEGSLSQYTNDPIVAHKRLYRKRLFLACMLGLCVLCFPVVIYVCLTGR